MGDCFINMDYECIGVCHAMNSMDGIATTESCCGHGKVPFRVYFTVEKIENLLPVLSEAREIGWRCYAQTDSFETDVWFVLESISIGVKAYGEAEEIAKFIQRQDTA